MKYSKTLKNIEWVYAIHALGNVRTHNLYSKLTNNMERVTKKLRLGIVGNVRCISKKKLVSIAHVVNVN